MDPSNNDSSLCWTTLLPELDRNVKHHPLDLAALFLEPWSIQDLGNDDAPEALALDGPLNIFFFAGPMSSQVPSRIQMIARVVW